jgi:hypothetical protein
MWQAIKGHWGSFVGTFHKSEVILWARFQILLGAAFAAMQMVDMSLFITDRQALQGYIFFNAIVTELLRRRRSDFGEGRRDDDR